MCVVQIDGICKAIKQDSGSQTQQDIITKQHSKAASSFMHAARYRVQWDLLSSKHAQERLAQRRNTAFSVRKVLKPVSIETSQECFF